MKPGQLLVIYSFTICLVLMLLGILSAKSTNELLISLIYLPLTFYFGTKILFFKNTKKTVKQIKPNQATSLVAKPEITEVTKISPEPEIKVADNDKRLFLKLIGSAGVSLMFMALFTKKAQASFFGSAPTGPGTVNIKDIAGNKINPAEKSPTDGYSISNIDNAGSPAYYGFVNKSGEWYILQDTSGSFRYAKGTSDFSINWGVRGALTYGYFNSVFG